MINDLYEDYYWSEDVYIQIYRLTQQAMEMHKRKAVESSQTAADLKLHLDKYQAQLKEAQIAVAEKTASLEQEVFKYKRMQVRRSFFLKKTNTWINRRIIRLHFDFGS